MAATIQFIQKPTKARALDTSTSYQIIGSDLNTDSNPTSVVNESNDVSSSIIWETNDIVLESSIKTDGSYSIKFTANGNGDRCWVDLNGSPFSLSTEKRYRISIDTRHVGSGDDYILQFNQTSGLNTGVAQTAIATITSSDTTFVTYTYDFSFDNDMFRYFGIKENGDNNNAAAYIDNFTIYELESFGNNNHGQIYSGRALEFDGVSDKFTNGTAVEGISKFADGKEWTFACWLYFDSTMSGDIYYVGKYDSTNPHIVLENTGNLLQIRDSGSDYYNFNASVGIETNTWYRQVIVSNGVTATCYLNGVLHGTIADGQTDKNGANGWNNTQMYFNGWGTPYETSGTWYYHMNGKMSDGQVWDAAWTADDALYDYNNPEQLALNRGGTSLTNSNLKLWYPMNDGHRGQQSYILDASNTGLGDSALTNGDFSDGATTGWTLEDVTGTVGTYHGESNVCEINVSATNSCYMYQNNILTAGVIYKISLDYYLPSSNTNVDELEIRNATGTVITSLDNLSTTDSWTSVSQYYTCIGTANDGIYLYLRQGGSSNGLNVGDDVYVKNVKALPINDKNHATTVFYGDELLTTSDDRSLGASHNWVVTDGQWAYDGTNDELDYTAGAEGSTYLISDPDIITGRTYKLVFENDNGDDDTKITIKDGAGDDLIADTRATDSTFTASDGAVPNVGSGTTANAWNPGSGGAITIASNTLKVNNSGAAAGMANYLRTTVANRHYHVSIDLVAVSGQSNADINIGPNADGSSPIIESDSVTAATHTLTFKASGTATYINLANTGTDTNDYSTWDNFTMKEVGVNELEAEATYTDGTKTVEFVSTSSNSGLTITAASDSGAFSIESFTIKEVGTASGWTDADQQLNIPQTALQSYNQLAWFQNDVQGASITNYVSIPDDATLDVGTGDFSVSCWFYKSTIGTSGDSDYIFRKGGAGDEGYAGRVTGTGKISCNLDTDAGSNQWVDSAANVIEAGKWYHVVFSWDRSDKVYCYLNGEEITSGDFPDTITGNSNTLDNGHGFYIGANSTSAGGFRGTVTEVVLFKNRAIGIETAKTLYNDGKAFDAMSIDQASYITGYWRNNGLAQWKDLSGEDNHSSTVGNITETMLITAGADGSRDSQGFLMNRQRATNSLNLTHGYDGTTAPDGLSMYVDLVDTMVYDKDTDRSWSFWIKRKSKVASTGTILGGADKNFQFISVTNNSNDNARIGIESDTNGDVAYSDSGSIHSKGLDAWIHVIIVADAGVCSFYIDGEKIGANSNPIADDVSLRYIGRAQPTVDTNRTFDGEIDDLLIYDKVLSDGGVSEGATAKGEVKRIYNAGKRSHR